MDERYETDTLTFVDVLGLLNRRKWIIILVTLIGSIGVFLYAYLSLVLPPERTYLPDYYTPQAHVIIQEEGAGGLSSLLASYGLSGLQQTINLGGGSSKPSQLAIAIARSDTFVDAVAKEFDFHSRYSLANVDHPITAARQTIKKSLQFSYDQTSGLMTIGYRSEDKVLATDIVNFVLNLLEKEFQRISVDRNTTQLSIIETKVTDVGSEITRIRNEIEDLENRYRTYDIAAMAKDLASKLASLRADLVQKNLEIDAYTRAVGIEDPALRKMKLDRDTLKASIVRMERGYNADGIQMPAEKDLRGIVTVYEQLKGELDLQTRIYASVIQQQELVKLEVESVPPTFQVYERAAVPEVKSGPSRTMICIIVGGVSLFLGIVLAFVVDYFSRLLRDPSRVRKLKGLTDAP